MWYASDMSEDIIKMGGYNSKLAESVYLNKYSVFPTHPLHSDRIALLEAMESYKAEQSSLGWPDMPDSYRKRAVRGDLQDILNLPEGFRSSVVYQAYYFSLDQKKRKKARANGNQIYISWSPHTTFIY